MTCISEIFCALKKMFFLINQELNIMVLIPEDSDLQLKKMCSDCVTYCVIDLKMCTVELWRTNCLILGPSIMDQSSKKGPHGFFSVIIPVLCKNCLHIYYIRVENTIFCLPMFFCFQILHCCI